MAADLVDDLIATMGANMAPRAGRTAPSQAWGVFTRDGLAHAEGTGEAASAPADTAFRIASCTKSFTATMALLLVEDGELELHEPLADALGIPLRWDGEGIPTIEDALAMRTGLPTDDPWADRQESLSDDAFAGLLADGVRAVRPAGTRYEYSNLGYAIVGRVIAERAGRPFIEVVRDRILRPLGLDATAFTARVPAVGGVIPGYRPGPGGWEIQAFSGPGAFSPIGGLFSTIRDLSAWCTALDGAHRALPHAVVDAMHTARTPFAGDPRGANAAYGFGLILREDGAGHRFLAHSGGYPGFTSHMVWEQGSGVGAVAFENASYTEVADPVRLALDATFGSHPISPPPPERDVVPWPETAEAARRVAANIADGRWDPSGFDPCVELDEPLERRQRRLADALERIGGIDAVIPTPPGTAAEAGFDVRGPLGRFGVSFAMTPTARTRIQRIDISHEDGDGSS
ncbi:MAG: serine hydrolase domain-containing protein [Protaetiibacter sp.]